MFIDILFIEKWIDNSFYKSYYIDRNYRMKGGIFVMQSYQKMYYKLFNAATDAIQAIENGDSEESRHILILAQQDCEELFLCGTDSESEEY